MANKNRLAINPELPTPGGNVEFDYGTPESEQRQQNSAETNVDNATSRLESLEGRGAEIRGKVTEKLKNFGRNTVSVIDRQIGRTAAGVEAVRDKVTDMREYASDVKDAASERLAQRQDRRERSRTTKEAAKSEQYYAIQDQYDAAYTEEVDRLQNTTAGDTDSFNDVLGYVPRGNKNERTARRLAKEDVIDAAHTEALEGAADYEAMYAQRTNSINAELNAGQPNADAWETPFYLKNAKAAAWEAANNDAYEAAHAEALEADEARTQEIEDAYNDAEQFLDQFKKTKDVDLTDIVRAFHDKFPPSDSHVDEAREDALAVFTGKKMKKAARAARIKRGREKITNARKKSAEVVRDRSSETYQKAKLLTKDFGSAIAKFSRRTATAGSSGFNAARAAWNSASEATPSDAEPNLN